MENEKNCPWCGESFTPDHGNDLYCSYEHAVLAKKERQKQRRDPVAKIIATAMRNHERINTAYSTGKTELTADEITALEIDIALSIFVRESPANDDGIILDFGEYDLITYDNFKTFKIRKHETTFQTE